MGLLVGILILAIIYGLCMIFIGDLIYGSAKIISEKINTLKSIEDYISYFNTRFEGKKIFFDFSEDDKAHRYRMLLKAFVYNASVGLIISGILVFSGYICKSENAPLYSIFGIVYILTSLIVLLMEWQKTYSYNDMFKTYGYVAYKSRGIVMASIKIYYYDRVSQKFETKELFTFPYFKPDTIPGKYVWLIGDNGEKHIHIRGIDTNMETM